MTHCARRRGRSALTTVLALAVLAIAPLVTLMSGVSAASAHGFTSVVYADIRAGESGHVEVELQLEYDLLVVSAADAEDDDPLFQDGTAAFEAMDPDAETAALSAHRDTVLAYIADRFTVTSGGAPCPAAWDGTASMTERDGAPYAVLMLDAACEAPTSAHDVTSTLFADDEGYVTGTTTILTYDLDLQTGSAALDASQPSFSTEQSLGERLWEFFVLGAEHLITGIDHILFLLALIVGSRRLREVVLAATAFTIAHSVTFVLAATGVVTLPALIVEPIIALSIAIVAAWHLWGMWRRGDVAPELTLRSGPLGLDRAGWIRLGIVFLFGLIHGMGFASALGIDEPWSWALLGSLLVFNVGIEAVQIAVIAIVFPLLTLLRRRMPRIGMWASGLLALAVTVTGLVWFVQRVLGL